MLKIITLNIEGGNHYDKIFPFFEAEQADIICLQEFFLEDLALFEEKLQMKGYAVGMWTTNLKNTSRVSPKGEMGVVIFSKLPFQSTHHQWYVGEEQGVIEMFAEGVGPEKVSRAVLWADIEKDGKIYRIVTTHFTWSPAGSVTDTQRKDLQNLLKVIRPLGEIILCGDFNAPRGKEIFDALASIYMDNVPKSITTSIDQHLHRQPGIQFMVDGLFTTPKYQALNVRMVDGVSDHCSIVAEIKSA